MMPTRPRYDSPPDDHHFVSGLPLSVVIVSQYFWPERAMLPTDLARGLRDRGHDVRVLTAFPNYPEGRIYPGHRQRWRHEEDFEGIRVRRVPMFMNHSSNALLRAVSYLSFAVSTLFATGWAKRADVVYIYASQMTPAIAPVAWRTFRKTPFVLHVQDLWPGSITGSNFVSSGRARRIVDAVLRPWLASIYGRAAATIAIAPRMADVLIEDGAPEQHVRVIYNWADEASLAIAPPVTRVADKVTFLYAGNLGVMQDLETVLEAAEIASARPEFRLRLVGDGIARERLESIVRDRGLHAVTIEDRLEQAELAGVASACDFQIVCLKDLPIFRGTIPSKFQSSLAMGMPVVTNIAGDVHDIVQKADIGFLAEPEDPVSLAEAFGRACELTPDQRGAMSERARDYYRKAMSRDRGIDAIEETLRRAAQESAPKRKRRL